MSNKSPTPMDNGEGGEGLGEEENLFDNVFSGSKF